MNALVSPLQWHADALWEQLVPYLPGLSVEVLARAESTNTLLIDRARGGGRHDPPVTAPGDLDVLRPRTEPAPAPGPAAFGRRQGDSQPCLLVAEHQTLGRGRQGRVWYAAPGASLTFSLGLPLAPQDWSGLSLAVGVALADALDVPEPGRPAPRLRLKWPNDLWLADAAGSGRKIGGVLIETVSIGARRMAVIGVGLNIEPLPVPREAADLASGYACLRELDPRATAPAVLHRVALPLVRAVLQFEREGFAGFAAAYARRDLLRGQPVQVHAPRSGEVLVDGIAETLGPGGALRVRDGAGTLHEITSGEARVRLPGASPSR